MTAQRSRWRMLAAVMAVCMLAVMSLRPMLTVAQAAPEGSRAQVVAQGVDRMPRTEVAWRLTASEAAPADEAGYFDRTLGFAIGADDPILVTNGDTGAATLLQNGQASFHAEGANERRSSTTDHDANYVNIELIAADAVDDDDTLGTSTLLFASDEFAAPRGDRNLQLTSAMMAPAEETTFRPATDAPYLLYVTDGIVEVTNDTGASFEISAGNAGAFAGEVDILAGANQGGSWMIAAIGDEVELPPAPTATPDDDVETGTLEITLEACPGGFEANCEPTTNADVTVPAFHLVSDENWIIPDRAEVSDDGTTYTYENLPAGDYTTGPEEDPDPGVNLDGATWDDALEGWDFTIRPERTKRLALQVITDDRGDTGSLLVTLYDCPAGVDPAVDDSDCELATDSWNVLVENPGQSDTTTWSLDDDALDLGDGQYWFELLPATDLVFWPDDTRDAGLDGYAIGGDPAPLGNIFTVAIPYHGAAEAVVYRLAQDDPDGGDTGGLFYSLFTCPADTERDDLTACENATEPWDVTFENVDTGDTWSTFGDADGNDFAQYYFPELPAGTYAIGDYNPDGGAGGKVYFGGEANTDGDPPLITIEPGGEHQLSVYYVPAGDAPEVPTEEPTEAPAQGIGSLVIIQVDCPYGADVSVDASSCDLSSAPWEVTVTNDETGESWSLLAEGVASDPGVYVLEALPEGSYSISVAGDGNWALHYNASTYVSADNETYETIYSVDLREP